MAARAACGGHAASWSPRAGLSMRTATRTAATTHRTKEVPGPLLTEEHGKASAASSILQANTNGVPVRGSVNCISVTQTLCQTRPEKPDSRAASAARRRVETLISPRHFSGPARHPLSISVLTFVPAWMRRGSRSGEVLKMPVQCAYVACYARADPHIRPDGRRGGAGQRRAVWVCAAHARTVAHPCP